MSKPPSPMMSERYQKTCEAISRAIAEWFEVHPGADPQFHFPPERVVITGDLMIGLEMWSPNADARDLVKHVDESTNYDASMLQFQVCYAHYQQHGRKPNA